MAFSNDCENDNNWNKREILSIIDKIDGINKKIKKIEKETLSDNALLSILIRIDRIEKILEDEVKMWKKCNKCIKKN